MTDTDEAAPKPARNATQKAALTKKQVSEVVEKLKNRAEGYVRDPGKAKKLLEDAATKAKGFQKNRGPLGEVWSYLTALFRLLKSYVGGRYRTIPWGSIVLAAVAIFYFVSPADLIPDLIAGAGYVDDAAVIGFVVAQIKSDLDDYLAWEVTEGIC